MSVPSIRRSRYGELGRRLGGASQEADVQVSSERLTPEYRFVLTAKQDQAAESGDAAIVTAAVLATAIVVALRLLHGSVFSIVGLSVPMMLSGVVGYAYCRRRVRALRADIEAGSIVTGTARSQLTRLGGSAEGSYTLRLPDRTVGAYVKGAGLRSVMLKPDPGTFSGSFAYAPRSGQLLRLTDRTGRSIFDAAAVELDETFDFSELESV
jgi:hypothetical protein